MHPNRERQLVKDCRRFVQSLNWPQPEILIMQMADLGIVPVDAYVRLHGVPLWERMALMDTRHDN